MLKFFKHPAMCDHSILKIMLLIQLKLYMKKMYCMYRIMKGIHQLLAQETWLTM